MIRLLLSLLVGLLLARNAEAASTKSQSSQPNVGSVRLFFIWPRSHMFKTGTIDVKIDGQVVGKIGPDSYFVVNSRPGSHTLKVEPPFDFAYFETEVTLKAGGTYYYAIAMKPTYVPLSSGAAVAIGQPNHGAPLQQKGGGFSMATYRLRTLDRASATSELPHLDKR